MQKKKAPYILVIALVVVLFFIVGFRAGQNVEKTNKQISFTLSIAPTATLAPTAKPLSFTTLETKGCGISLLYPDSLTLAQQGTQSARFTEKNKMVIEISCVNWTKLQPTSVPAIPTGIISNQPLSMTKNEGGVVGFQVKHPYRNILISVEVEKTLYPLILQGLNFVRQ